MDLRRRQAMHALLTHRRFVGRETSWSFSRPVLPPLPLPAVWEVPAVSAAVNDDDDDERGKRGLDGGELADLDEDAEEAITAELSRPTNRHTRRNGECGGLRAEGRGTVEQSVWCARFSAVESVGHSTSG